MPLPAGRSLYIDLAAVPSPAGRSLYIDLAAVPSPAGRRATAKLAHGLHWQSDGILTFA